MNQKKASPKANDLCIYISSFDGYTDVWNGFFKRFEKFWPDCPYPRYLGCNQKTADYKDLTILHTKGMPDWSTGVIEHLSQIKEDYILLLLEDYYLSKKVDTDLIETMFGYVKTLDLAYLSLFAYPPTDTAIQGYPLIGFNSQAMQNRMNTQAAIWKKEVLIDLLRKGESPWEFEINGSARSNRYAGQFCGVWKHAIHYQLAVGRGKWHREVYHCLRREGIEVDTSIRSVEGWKGMIWRIWGEKLLNIFRFILPYRYRQKLSIFIKNIFKK